MSNSESPKPIYNRPGLPAIVYRIGDYNSFRQRLLSQLSVSPKSLAKLTTRSNEDAAIALLDAWAVVADVLTFYQERIANEGYLRTATERFSVLELARTIGYELSPGVAASTYLAFTVDDAPGSVTQAVVPQGTPVMSIPVKDDEVPQTFETSAEILAHLDWNSIKPRLIKPQIISENINQIYLEGNSTQLQPGDWILLIDNQEQDIKTYLLNLTAVEILADNNYTLITWEKQLPDNINSRLRNPQIFAFRNSASLFGKNAPKWEEMPDEIKKAEGGTVVGGIFSSDDSGSNWTPKNKGLPNTDILSLAANQLNQYLFAGTPDRGIFRSQDSGENWEAVNAGLTNLNIQSLYIETEKGHIFAGTPGGGVFRSKDNGENWVPIHTGSVRVEIIQVENEPLESFSQPVNTAIPNTVVRSLLTYSTTTNLGTGTIESEGTTVTGEGTEFTREFNVNDTITAGSQSKTIVAINSDVSLRVDSAFVPVLASGTSFTTPNREINYIFAGTDNGVYRSQDVGKNWIPQGLFDGLSDRVIRAFATDNSYIFAGTDNGIYRSQDEGNNWITVNNGELNANTVVYSLTIYQRAGNSYLFAGTNLGVYSSQNPGDSWTIVNNDLPPNTVVYSLATYERDEIRYLFAGTNQGIFFSTNNGDSWQPISQDNLTIKDIIKNITSLAVKNHNNNHQLFAGRLFSGFKEEDWAGFEVTEPQIYLDTLYPKILENSWIVLLDENVETNKNYFQAFQVNKVSTASRSDFNLTSEVTRIVPSKSVKLSGLRRRNTQVLVQSESLTLAPEVLTVTMQQENIFLDPINQNKIYLNKFISNLESNKTLIVSGKHIRAIAENIGGFFVWKSDESKWERNNLGLTNTSVQALVIDGDKTQYIGTAQGVFRLQDGDKTWEPLKNEALEDTNIQSLLIHPQTEAIFAGTPTGIFRYSKNNWQAVNQGLAHLNVQTLVSYQDGETISIFAGTLDGGVFASRNNGENWTSTGLSNVDVQTLAVNQDSGDLFAGTFQKGVFHSVNGGNSWEQLTNIERGTGTISSDNITVQGVGLDLTQLHQGDIINAGGQIRTVLAIDESTQTFTIDTAFRPDLPERTAFTINTGLTNLNITSLLIVPQSEQENKINNKIFAGTAGSGIFRSEDNGKRWKPVNNNLNDLEIRTLAANSSNEIFFAGTASKGVFRSLNNGELWAAINDGLTNTDVKAIAIFPDTDNMIVGGNGILISEDDFYTTPLQKGDLLWVISPPIREDKYHKWYVRDINNFVGNIRIPVNEELSLQPATDDDGMVSEVCTIKNPPTDQQNPIITLNKPLKYAYDPETVTIYGNVVMATHGESVVEVMGSGDGTIPNQRFILKEPPLTYVPAPVATGAKSTLEVRVDDVLWENVDTLYQQDAHLQGYIIRLTDDGTPVITFGDGGNGARLPTGEENITATYRSGIGLEGQVLAESLTQIKDKPLGIVEVTNPLTATGAAPPESRDSAREKAPSKVRTLDRIVSLQDFEDFARAFAGIGKAQAVPLWNGQSQLVHITVAAADGSPVDENTNLYQQLVTAIDNNRDPHAISRGGFLRTAIF